MIKNEILFPVLSIESAKKHSAKCVWWKDQVDCKEYKVEDLASDLVYIVGEIVKKHGFPKSLLWVRSPEISYTGARIVWCVLKGVAIAKGCEVWVRKGKNLTWKDCTYVDICEGCHLEYSF